MRAAALPAAALAWAGCARAPATFDPAPAGVVSHVIVVSIDGLRPDVIAAHAPALRALADSGAYTLRARTIVPPKTLPSHASMLTGVEPEVHGITWNRLRGDLAEGRVAVPTVFDLARCGGRASAAFIGKAKFHHLLRPGTPERAWLPRRQWETYLAADVVAQATDHLRWRRPSLLFVHLADPDLAGHAFGWMSVPYRRWGVSAANDAVARLLRAARAAYGEDFVMIVTADHGGTGRGHGEDTDADRLIPWIAYGRGVRPGPLQTPVRTTDTAATVLWLLGIRPPAEWTGTPVTEAFAAAPARLEDVAAPGPLARPDARDDGRAFCAAPPVSPGRSDGPPPAV